VSGPIGRPVIRGPVTGRLGVSKSYGIGVAYFKQRAVAIWPLGPWPFAIRKSRVRARRAALPAAGNRRTLV
jgi:hypothetical protein